MKRKIPFSHSVKSISLTMAVLFGMFSGSLLAVANTGWNKGLNR